MKQFFGTILWLYPVFGMLGCQPALYKISYYKGGGKKQMTPFNRNDRNIYVCHGTEYGWYANGYTMFKRPYQMGVIHGKQKIWRPDGRLWVESDYKNGFLLEERRFDTVLNRWSIQSYRLVEKAVDEGKGLPSGIQKMTVLHRGKQVQRMGYYRSWHDNGQLAIKYMNFGGRPHGHYRRWHSNGYMALEGYFLLGKRVGDWVSWHANGKIKSVSAYHDNLMHGWSQNYYTSGQIKDSSGFRYNKISGLQKSWYGHGLPKEEVFYKDGQKNGFFTQWYPSGVKMRHGRYQNGVWQGTIRSWYSNGIQKFRGEYRSGKQWGKQTQWYENGMRFAEMNCVAGLVNGLYKWWTKEGELISVKKYKKGMEIWDSREDAQKRALDAAGENIPMGVKGFYWGMDIHHVKANIFRQGGLVIHSTDTSLAAKLPAGHIMFLPVAQSRFSFNQKNELYSIQFDFEKKGHTGSFEFAKPLEGWLNISLGMTKVQQLTRKLPNVMVKKRLWGRYRWHSIRGNKKSAWQPVIQVEAYNYRGKKWVRYSLVNHLLKEYGQDSSTVLEGPFYDS